MNNHPPKLFLRFFRWFCHPRLQKPIEGDLMELYDERVKELGKRKADRKFRKDVLQLFRPSIIKPADGTYRLTNYGMLQNYFKITWRSLWRQKTYSVINIGGLAVGLTCFLLIFLYVQHELSYDKFYKNHDQIYRVYQEGGSYNGTNKYAYTTVGLAPAMLSEIPEVVNATIISEQSALLSSDRNKFYEEGLIADAQFFKVFKHPLMVGDPNTVLSKPNTIVLTESFALRIFGNKDPMGEMIIYQNSKSFKVTGVMKDLPSNSSIKFSFLTPMLSYGQYVEEMKGDQWNNVDYHTFFTLEKETNQKLVEGKFPELLEKYHPADEGTDSPIYLAQKLSEFHMETDFNFDFGVKGNSAYMNLFSVIAIIVLLLACVNYMNLAIARSIKRAKEVGLRKVIGAVRFQLILQFIGESILIAFLSLVLALGLVFLFAPYFGYWLDRPLALDLISNAHLIPTMLLLMVVVGTISGSYPAFFMSSLVPAEVLKSGGQGQFSGSRIQRWLVASQYAVSIVLIVGSFVVYHQFKYINNKELGYDKEHLLTIPIHDRQLSKHIGSLKDEWAINPNITSVTTALELPSNVTSGTKIRHLHESREEGFIIYRARVDYNYIDVFGIELITGRDFSPHFAADQKENYIINESAARAFGWTPEEAVGKQIKTRTPKTVIGVVKDFHMHSLHREIAPLLLMMRNDNFSFIALKVRPENLSETIASINESLTKYSPYPFEYQFLDQRVNQLYKSEEKFGELFLAFTGLAILVASMGLFGLAAFTASQRTKEIGIRKVLGASVSNIVGRLVKDFLKLILAGFIAAVPLSFYIMDKWLSNFAYRIDIPWWLFVKSGLLVVAVAVLTISTQSIKAALSNPADCLHNE